MFREHFTSLMRSFVQNEFKRSYVIGQVFRVGNFDICWCEMQREARLGHQNSPQLLNFRPTGRYRRIKRLSLAKMLSGVNTFGISKMQEDETGVALSKRFECNSVTLHRKLLHGVFADHSGPSPVGRVHATQP